MKIFITGASSYVGARLYFDLRKNFEVVGSCHDTKLSKDFVRLDITDKNAVQKILSLIKPDLIIHVAANANSRWCEANPELAIQLNEEGTKNIVAAANSIAAKIIYISSFAAFEPVDIYGGTKLASEELVKNTKAGFVILRPSFILGFSPNTTNDRPFNRILKNLDEHTEAIYDTSWKFQPTYLGHISEVIEAVIKKKIDKEMIPIAVPEMKSRYETAKDILEKFGVQVSAVDSKSTLPHFKNNLQKLKELDLPQYSYSQMIEKIIDEIKHREKFVLE